MSNNIGNRGGKRENSGRKPKEYEQKLIERLKPFDDIVLSALETAINEGKDWAVKLFFQYRYGMPKQLIESNDKYIVVANPLDNIRAKLQLDAKPDDETD